MRQKLHVFFVDLWNIFDTISVVLFFTGFGIRMSEDLILHGRVFYCITVTIFVIRVFDFFDVSRRLGPFIQIVGKFVSVTNIFESCLKNQGSALFSAFMLG